MRPQLCAVTLVCVLAACGSKKNDGGGGPPLKEVRDDAFGYAIKVVDGSKQTEKENDRHVWSWSPDNGVNSYHCIIQPEKHLDAFTPEAARKSVEVVRAPGDIKSAAAVGTDGILVELAEDSSVHYRESWFYKKGATTTMVAICSGPAKGSTITDMAKSLQATK